MPATLDANRKYYVGTGCDRFAVALGDVEDQRDARSLRSVGSRPTARGYRDDPELALCSIKKLKQLAQSTGAALWPNHDLAFFQAQKPFPDSYP